MPLGEADAVNNVAIAGAVGSGVDDDVPDHVPFHAVATALQRAATIPLEPRACRDGAGGAAETLGGAPLAGRTVRFSSPVHLPESGELRTTDAAGEVSFPVRAGIAVGGASVEFASAGATTASATLTGTAPAAGTIFSALNGPRYGLVSTLPQTAWLTSATDDWSDVVSAPDGTLYCGCTIDLDRRLDEHNTGKGAKYVRGRTPAVLIAARHGLSKSAAHCFEAQVKRLPSKRKKAFVKSCMCGDVPRFVS